MSNRSKTLLLVVHVTATPLSYKMTSAKLRAMHKSRGFSDIGYNEWIDRKGVLHKGRGVDAIGAHVAGYNSIAYGCALEGGHKKADATPKMMGVLEKRLRELTVKYPNAKICGHRDLSPDGDGDGVIEPHEHTKQCPWFDAIPWAESRGLPGADIKGIWDTHSRGGPDHRDRWLQKLLRGKGYLVVADGYIGPTTIKQIKQFQRDFGLSVTGKFDEATVARLRDEPSTKADRLPAKRAPAPKVPAGAKVGGGIIAGGGAVIAAEPSLWPFVLGFAAIAGVVAFVILKKRKKS